MSTIIPDWRDFGKIFIPTIGIPDEIDSSKIPLDHSDKMIKSVSYSVSHQKKDSKIIDTSTRIIDTSIRGHSYEMLDISRLPNIKDDPQFIHVHGILNGVDAKILNYEPYSYSRKRFNKDAKDLHFIFLSENLEKEAYEKLFQKPRGFECLAKEVLMLLTRKTSRDSFAFLTKIKDTESIYGCCLITSSISIVDYLYQSANQMIEYLQQEHAKIECKVKILKF